MPENTGGAGVPGPSGGSGPQTFVTQYGSANVNDGSSTLSTPLRPGAQPYPVGPSAPNRADMSANEKSTQAIEEALKDMAGSAKDLGRTYQVMEDVLKKMNETIEKMGRGIKDSDSDLERSRRKWREIDVSVAAVVRSVDDAEDSFRKILTLQKQISRDPGFFNTRSREDAKAFYADILKQAERIKRAGIGQQAMQELKIVTDGAKKSMELLGEKKAKALSAKEAKELSSILGNINEQVLDIGDNVKNVKFSVWNDAMKKADRAFEETFDKKFAGTAFGQMVLGKFGKQFEQIKGIAKLRTFGEKLQKIPEDQRHESFQRLQKNLGSDHSIVRAIAQENEKREKKKGGTTGTTLTTAAAVAASGAAPGATAEAAAAGAGAAPSTKGGKKPRKEKKNRGGVPAGAAAGMPNAPAATATVPRDFMPEVAGAHGTIDKFSNLSWINRKVADLAMKHAGKVLGGEATGGIGGLIGKGAMRLVGAGAGTATTGAAGLAGGGLAGGLLGGAGRLLTKANPIMMAVGAVISARDMVVKENKEMLDALGGAGITAHGTDFTSARSTLMSTGTLDKTLYGMGTYKQNLDMMAALGQHGYSVADLNASEEGQRPDLGEAMKQGTGGFYGSLMKNVQYYGRNVGMDEKQSTGLTMDLADKYRLTMEKTSKFFLQIDAAQRTAGLSAMKYVQIVEDINSQFDEFNRGLRTTTSLLNVLGRSGRLTGDQLKDMVKSLTANPQQNMAQRVVSAQGMIKSGAHLELAKQLEDDIKASVDDAAEAVRNVAKGTEGLKGERPTFNGSNQSEVLAWMDANKEKIGQNEYRAAAGAMQTADQKSRRLGVMTNALRSGKAAEIAGAVDFAGQNPDINMALNRASLKSLLTHTGALKQGGSLAQILASPDQQKAAFSNRALVTAQMQSSGVFAGKSLEDVQKIMESLGMIASSSALKIRDLGTRTAWRRDAAGNEVSAEESTKMLKKEEIAALAEAARTLGKGVLGKEVSPTDNLSAATQMVEYMKKSDADGKKTLKILESSESWLEKQTSGSAETAKLVQSVQSEAAAAKKAKDTRMATRESADIFADAFSALFMKIVDALSTLGKVFDIDNWKKFFGGGDEQEKRQEAEASNAAKDLLPILQKLRNTKEGRKDQELQALLGSAEAGKLTPQDMQKIRTQVYPRYQKDLSAADAATIGYRTAKGSYVEAGGDLGLNQLSYFQQTGGNAKTGYRGQTVLNENAISNITGSADPNDRKAAWFTLLAKTAKDANAKSVKQDENGTLIEASGDVATKLSALVELLNKKYNAGAKTEKRGDTTIITFPTVKSQILPQAAAADSQEGTDG